MSAYNVIATYHLADLQEIRRIIDSLDSKTGTKWEARQGIKSPPHIVDLYVTFPDDSINPEPIESGEVLRLVAELLATDPAPDSVMILAPYKIGKSEPVVT